MLREMQPGLYVDDVATEKPGVKTLNLSFIPGNGETERSLLIDSGLPTTIAPACREHLIRDVEALGIAWEKLDCIFTHAHRDHVGQAAFLNEKGSRVFMNPADLQGNEDMFNHEILHPDLRMKLFHHLGMELSAPEVLEDFWRAADQFIAGYEHVWEFSWEPVAPGTVLHYGNYTFDLVPLPGHTIGHMGLWEKEKKLLFSGDQIVFGLAPIVGDTGHYPNALEDYMNSMRDVIHKYGDCLFIPGHGEPFRNPKEEGEKVIQSYLDKCSIMFEVLQKSDKPLCVWGVSSRSYGRYGKHLTDAERRSHILILFKTYACLNYMKGRGLVKETLEDGVSLWTAAH